jgi:hypothetical protein
MGRLATAAGRRSCIGTPCIDEPRQPLRPARTRAAIVGELTRQGSKRYKLKGFVTVAQNEAA